MSKAAPSLEIRARLEREYDDVYTPAVRDALHALAGFNGHRRRLMRERIERRARRARDGERIGFLDPGATIGGTDIGVQAARDGAFAGSEIPADLERQWIQGTGPGAKPNTPMARSIRNVAYALLSGADGWMFDGEDALGQITTMSLDNQRNLAPGHPPATPSSCRRRSRWLRGDERVGLRASSAAGSSPDWEGQLGFTTKIFRARGLHLDDRHTRDAAGGGPVGLDRRHWPCTWPTTTRSMRRAGLLHRPLPAEDPDRRARPPCGTEMLDALEAHLGLAAGRRQGLRPRGAARGHLPAHGDPRRPGPPLRGLQHRPLGLHQQRLRRHGLGRRGSSIRTSRPSP